MNLQTYTGINIQFPISRLILDGAKTVETRTYPIPTAYVGKELVMVETPGKKGDFHARIVGLVTFGESIPYKTKEHFYRDRKRHFVDPDSPWRWIEGKGKWGWPILKVTRFAKPKPAPKAKGIIYTKGIRLT